MQFRQQDVLRVTNGVGLSDNPLSASKTARFSSSAPSGKAAAEKKSNLNAIGM